MLVWRRRTPRCWLKYDDLADLFSYRGVLVRPIDLNRYSHWAVHVALGQLLVQRVAPSRPSVT